MVFVVISFDLSVFKEDFRHPCVRLDFEIKRDETVFLHSFTPKSPPQNPYDYMTKVIL